MARRAFQRPKHSLSRIVAIDKKNQINFTRVDDARRVQRLPLAGTSISTKPLNPPSRRCRPQIEFSAINFGLPPTGQFAGSRAGGRGRSYTLKVGKSPIFVKGLLILPGVFLVVPCFKSRQQRKSKTPRKSVVTACLRQTVHVIALLLTRCPGIASVHIHQPACEAPVSHSARHSIR